jgi:hypothetical protein
LADGSAEQQLECSGATWNWSACVEKASALCTMNSGYTIVAQKEEWAPSVSTGNGAEAPGSTGISRSVVIKCNKAA